MRSRLAALALAAAPGFSAARAEGEQAGAFDYYILALSWSPTWCALEGDARGAGQCDPRQDFGFTLHGLWPQAERGWPSYCRTAARPATRAETGRMADVMGSSGLAWHQWKKHGTCSGLTAAAYFDISRRAYESVALPEPFEPLTTDLRLPAAAVEDAFLDANPGHARNTITVTCAEGRIEEVRLCLTRDLRPRPCGEDAIRDCRMRDALMEKVR
jgi:ribonuclease T2